MVSSKSIAAGGLVAFFCCVSPWSAPFARDLEMLARVLVPAYTAQNFAALCAVDDSRFLSAELKEGVGSVAAYAQHVKIEVIVNIPEEEARRVLRMAADTARRVAWSELYQHAGGRLADQTPPLNRWCERSARPFILDLVTRHDERHPQFDMIVERAKR